MGAAVAAGEAVAVTETFPVTDAAAVTTGETDGVALPLDPPHATASMVATATSTATQTERLTLSIDRSKRGTR